MALQEDAASRYLSRKRDKVRERELLQYYNPADHPSNASPTGLVIETGPNLAHSISSPDLTLTALAQLCALRLDTRRCIISVLDRDIQYSLAESTRSLDLGCTQKSEAADDGLWIGRARMEKIAGLCESVVNTPPSKPGEPTACIVVPDLSKDPRFNHMAFVKGPPHFKFYVGMPITTKNNINIGSLCVMDEVPGKGISPEQQEFLAQISHAVMDNLERRREAEDRKKVMLMSQGLAAFVDGKNTLPKDDRTGFQPGIARAPIVRQPSEIPSKPSIGTYTSLEENGKGSGMERPNTPLGRSSPGNHLGNGVSSLRPHLKAAGSASELANSRSTASLNSTNTGVPPHESIDADYRETFARAANLLRESLSLHGSKDGVVFFDTAVGYGNEDDDSTAILELPEDAYNGDGPAGSIPQALASPDDTKRSADVLAFSSKERPLNYSDRLNDEDTFSPVSEILLKALVKQYPRGKLWSFDEDGSLSSSEDELFEGQPRPKVEPSRSNRKLNEDSLIQKHFPDVRQLLFTPLWDSGLSRWFSGCFCWAASNVHVFSSEVEGSFLLAFGNSIMAEVSRLATMAADKQKGDFIGSISHELRSPLHGILASAEFLSETDYDAFQGSLVNTIESCGRTLLDTINHILDFSKINTFERNWRAVHKGKGKGNSRRGSGSSKDAGSATRSLGSRSQGPPLMNIYAVTDVAAICEEVVEGVYAGQVYQYISSLDISDITASARGKTSDRGLSGDNRTSLGKGGIGVDVKPIDIVLDIVHDDYTFTAQPGALRRVIMNIFGNAMKYTPSGTISVKLSLEPPDENAKNAAAFDNERMLKFVVKDTGKGISSAYLRTRLFTPFSQESSLAPGTGLGLSIVKSIVDMLNGTIDVRSQVGQGTEITVRIPLMRVSGNDTPLSRSSLSSDRTQDDSISALRNQWPDTDVALYIYPSETRRMLEHYVSEWFGLRLVASVSAANVAVVDEADLPALTGAELLGRAVVVLCTGTSGYGQAPSRTDGVNAMEFMSKPFGPFKLAKALRICLERAKDNIDMSDRKLSMKSSISNTSTIKPVLEHWTLDTGDEITPIVINGAVAAASTINALMAIGLTPEETSNRVDFPFLDPTDVVTKSPEDTLPVSPIHFPRPDSKRHNPQRTVFKLSQLDASSGRELGLQFPIHDESTVEGKSELHPSADVKAPLVPGIPNGTGDAVSPREKTSPWILIVDDNKINLRLLDTFMKKRKYTQVTPADNGRLAVQAVEGRPQGFDIIFMDISMPVMDGFEATRAIREIEEIRRQELTASKAPDQTFRPALIIALTGLASSRDQSEAFTSGVDLFMSKPVSFKEVGRILDNWEERRDA